MSVEQDIKNIVGYGLDVLKKQPEALTNLLERQSPEMAIPDFVVAIVNDAFADESVQPNVELAIGACLGILSYIDKILAKTPEPPTKEMRMLIIQQTVKNVIATNESLHEEANSMMDEESIAMAEGGLEETGKEPTEELNDQQLPPEEPVLPEEETKGVL